MVSYISLMALRLANRATADAVLQNARETPLLYLMATYLLPQYLGGNVEGRARQRRRRRRGRTWRDVAEALKALHDLTKGKRPLARGAGSDEVILASEMGNRGSIDEEEFEEDFDDRSSMELVGTQSSGTLTQGIRSHSPSQAEAGDGWSRKQKAPRHLKAD
ncbi:hypothetical protein B0A49_04751 [Cryomyces minteri]|uniref:Uncharacterized protein n=1 Tax=Cryomyces minteri TaxID=331657 RepID=A0A4U0XJN5_9PEZI|nr:hypothetical protein B0A49_04751 [Cryomyces minteri]